MAVQTGSPTSVVSGYDTLRENHGSPWMETTSLDLSWSDLRAAIVTAELSAAVFAAALFAAADTSTQKPSAEDRDE